MKEAVVCLAIIFVNMFGMQLFGIELQCEREPETEAINMQSLLRDGIITGHLLCKYHEPVLFS